MLYCRLSIIYIGNLLPWFCDRFPKCGVDPMFWHGFGTCCKSNPITEDAKEDLHHNNGEKVVARGKFRSVPVYSLLSSIKRIFIKSRSFGFKDSLINAARMVGKKKFLILTHTPLPLKKSIFENFFGQCPQLLEQNISHRFRHKDQYNPQELCYLLAFESGIAHLDPASEIYIKPVGRGEGYLDRKFAQYDQYHPIGACVQSLDLATEEDRRRVIKWLEGIIGIGHL